MDHLRHSQELHNHVGKVPEIEIKLSKYGKYKEIKGTVFSLSLRDSPCL